MSKLDARRRTGRELPGRPPFAELLLWTTKLIARDRRFRPVEARDFFFRKSSWLGTVDVEACSRVLVEAISSGGELGDGGLFERVVAELRFIDQRLVGGFRCAPSARLESDVPVLASPSVEVNADLSLIEFEFVRRKKLDIVRLKLDVEPRVGLLCSADPVSGSAVVGVDSGFEESLFTGVLGGRGMLTAAAVLSVRWDFGVGLVAE